MDPRALRALHFLAGLGLVLSVLVPTGRIETPWPPYTLQAWAYMEPFVWPFILLGVLFMAAAWSWRIRTFLPPASFLLGATSILIFLATLAAGRKALYDLWFPDRLGPSALLNFDLWPLIIHFAVMLAVAFGGLLLVARNWQRAHPELISAPSPALPSSPSPAIPSIPSTASAPELPPGTSPVPTPEFQPAPSPASFLPSFLYSSPPPESTASQSTPGPPLSSSSPRPEPEPQAEPPVQPT